MCKKKGQPTVAKKLIKISMNLTKTDKVFQFLSNIKLQNSVNCINIVWQGIIIFPASSITKMCKISNVL